MFDFVTIGTGTRDIFMRVAEGKVLSGCPGEMSSSLYLGFEYGAKLVTNDAEFSYGGGALNTAIALSKMGRKVAACFRIGKEGTGDVLLGEMEAGGVATKYVERDPDIHTGLSIVINVPDADHVLFHYPGAGARLELPALDAISARWLYLTSLTGQAARLLPRIEAKVRTDSIKLVFNPGQTQIDIGRLALTGLIAQAWALIVNRSEAAELVRSADPGAATDSIPHMLALMRSWGARHVVITDGQAGAYATDGAEVHFVPACPTRVVDTTGAGDAFGATFAAAMALDENDVAGALRLAAANAASVVARDGAHAGLLTLDEARRACRPGASPI